MASMAGKRDLTCGADEGEVPFVFVPILHWHLDALFYMLASNMCAAVNSIRTPAGDGERTAEAMVSLPDHTVRHHRWRLYCLWNP